VLVLLIGVIVVAGVVGGSPDRVQLASPSGESTPEEVLVDLSGAPPLSAGIVVMDCVDGAIDRPCIAWTSRPTTHVSAVAGLRVVLAIPNGAVLALDAVTGQARWRAAAHGPVTQLVGVPGAVVVLREDGRVVALDDLTGTSRWERTDADAHELSTAGAFVYLHTDGAVEAVAGVTGRTAWRTRLPGAQLVASHGTTPFVANRSRIQRLHDNTGEVAWSRRLRVADAMVTGDVLVTVDPAGRLRGLDLRSGRTRWTTWRGGPRAQLALLGGDAATVVVRATGVGDGGRMSAIDAADGTVRWAAPWRGARPSAAVVVGDLVVVTTPGAVEAWLASSGRRVWTYDTGYASTRVIAMGAADPAERSLRWPARTATVDGLLVTAGPRIAILDPTDGQVRTIGSSGVPLRDVLVADPSLAVVTTDMVVLALRLPAR
jgi:eukaryotic-like serine/threonine-protein kinase